MKSQSSVHVAVLVAMVLPMLGSPGVSLADPCGMVPPVYEGVQAPIARIGEQQTYVFFKDGVESFVIRPGYRGSLDEFGMLIPFPTPPAIRKVPDHIFPHLAAAVDPPEVVINLMLRRGAMLFADGAEAESAPMVDGLAIMKKEVVVLRQEAVGMYEVAVLQAGSSDALKKWMDTNGYRFPEGMDAACADYVREGWCFVAVKTKIRPKSGVDPRPGQRAVKGRMGKGDSFDGFVQAMGFRFRTKELVVPMRLSVFNEGGTRNVVYLLTDGPRRVRAIPEEFVRRQIPGKTLVDNLVNPLPLRIIGGDLEAIMDKDPATGVKRIMPAYGHNLKERRDPRPKNGAARELFASDLVAVGSGELSLPHEETEKVLLAIGERLGLRGDKIDRLNASEMTAQMAETVAEATDAMRSMTLTVVDGDFPREVLAKQNLTFGAFAMNPKKNNRKSWDASRLGPNPNLPQQGTLIREAISDFQIPLRWYQRDRFRTLVGTLTFGSVVLGLGFCQTRRRRRYRIPVAVLVLLAAGMAGVFALTAHAEAVARPADAQPLDPMIAGLAESDSAEAAVDQLVKQAGADPTQRAAIVQTLADAAGSDATETEVRGWAIIALGEIGGMDVDEILLKIQVNKKHSDLVRTWAAAARVAMCRSTEALIEKASLIAEFPALGRPIGKRIVDQLESDEGVSAESLLEASIRIPQIAGALSQTIIALGPDQLVTAMRSATDPNVRRQAAGYLASQAKRGTEEAADVARMTLQAYAFQAEAEDVPWTGGALFVPGINWTPEDAHTLVRSLIAWNVWAEENGKTELQRQIHNNIRGVGLSRKVGYQSPNFQFASAPEWLLAWGKVAGKQAVLELLAEQELEDSARYKSVLNGLDK